MPIRHVPLIVPLASICHNLPPTGCPLTNMPANTNTIALREAIHQPHQFGPNDVCHHFRSYRPHLAPSSSSSTVHDVRSRTQRMWPSSYLCGHVRPLLLKKGVCPYRAVCTYRNTATKRLLPAYQAQAVATDFDTNQSGRVRHRRVHLQNRATVRLHRKAERVTICANSDFDRRKRCGRKKPTEESHEGIAAVS